MRPVAYVSRRFTETQRKWPTIEKEAFALVYTLRKYDSFLKFGLSRFETDHANLKWVMDPNITIAKVQRWAVYVGEFHHTIRRISGVSNVVADGLTRVGVPELIGFVGHILAEGNNARGFDRAVVHDSDDLLARISATQNAVSRDTKKECHNDGFMRVSTRHGIKVWALLDRVLMPESNDDLTAELLRRAHGGAGHGGALRTLRCLCDAAVAWKAMTDDVKSYCGEFVRCQRCKPPAVDLAYRRGAWRPPQRHARD